MLTIRKAQMGALAVPDISLFVERAVNFLYENFPESLDEDPEELKKIVRRQLDKADSYGLVTEQQAMTYITSAWLLGVDFDTEFSTAQETLDSKYSSPDEKAEWLAEWTEATFDSLEED
jgi:hypothetical protein